MTSKLIVAIAIAIIHFVVFVFIAAFLVIGSMGAAFSGHSSLGPSELSGGEIIGFALAPTLLIPKLFGVRSLSPTVFFALVFLSSAIYGAIFSLIAFQKKDAPVMNAPPPDKW